MDCVRRYTKRIWEKTDSFWGRGMIMFQFVICFIAGIGAGQGTGFAGMSAAAVISPMLITFLDLPAYEAVGIALASDVLASVLGYELKTAVGTSVFKVQDQMLCQPEWFCMPCHYIDPYIEPKKEMIFQTVVKIRMKKTVFKRFAAILPLYKC